MEVPRFWRNNRFMVNPLRNGFRPEKPVALYNDVNIFVSEQAAQITSSLNQEVKAHSKIINEEYRSPIANSSGSFPINTQVSSGLIYQEN